MPSKVGPFEIAHRDIYDLITHLLLLSLTFEIYIYNWIPGNSLDQTISKV
jgi:hypothetical protein